ncbi:hypothetical protein [Saccharicrinis fermentans]|uniref:Uncharacterized protein n=1 Tax=Saccharicrinis fermentans DSM 9555 = JCM 21142 TaxID=869213 RepID=W7Y2B3_9BACT|nr:hypothetical protein [Saccharicrinis fermentans]GAF02072.1 hypothetical protein JCM21142_1699 [Saccharicrinis fermentans DSM 9555 = JCM 21142]
MKKSVIILMILTATVTLSNAQFTYLNDIKLESDEDYAAYSEQVLDCSYYLLMTPYNKKDTERKAATTFIVRWMKGSPSLNFKISNKIKALTDEKEELIALYISCYAKQLLEDEKKSLSQTELELRAIQSLASYCNNPNNKVKATKELKNIS